MKVSIISVAYNEEKSIARTIESVLSQTSKNIEYIICDGKSTDKTVEIAESYKEAFFEKNIRYFINSEKDSGIYDGMNKGIQMASGDYIFFLNAGDWFFSNDVIETIITIAKTNEKPDFIYGGVALIERNVIRTVFVNDHMLEQHMIPHQALFSLTDLMKANLFKTKYKLAADYYFVLKQKLDGKRFLQTEKLISYFSGDGVSSQCVLSLFKEHDEIRKELGVPSNFQRNVAYKQQLFSMVKNCIPQKIWALWCVKVKGRELYR